MEFGVAGANDSQSTSDVEPFDSSDSSPISSSPMSQPDETLLKVCFNMFLSLI